MRGAADRDARFGGRHLVGRGPHPRVGPVPGVALGRGLGLPVHVPALLRVEQVLVHPLRVGRGQPRSYRSADRVGRIEVVAPGVQMRIRGVSGERRQMVE